MYDNYSRRPPFLKAINMNAYISWQVRAVRNKDKPLVRRKSDLPQDTGTVRALNEHKRPDEFLTTPPDVNKC